MSDEYYNMSIEQLSKSKILCYLNCPFQFKLKYINHLPSPAGPAAERGKDIHDIVDKFFDRLPYNKMHPDMFEDILKRLCGEEKFEEYSLYMGHFIRMETERFNSVPKVHYRPKYREVHLGKNWRLHGIIDRIDYEPSIGKYSVWDYKTGHVGSIKSHLFELTLYSYLFSQHFKKVIPVVGIYDLKKGRKISTELTQSHYDEMLKIVDEVFQRIRNEEYNKNPKANCFWCPQNMKKICRDIWGVEVIKC